MQGIWDEGAALLGLREKRTCIGMVVLTILLPTYSPVDICAPGV